MLKSELIVENKRLQQAVDYLQGQMRVIPQSRFDKYRNASDTNETLHYRKAVQEVDRLCVSAVEVSNDILLGTE